MKRKKDGCCEIEHKQVILKTLYQQVAAVQYIEMLPFFVILKQFEYISFKTIAKNFPAYNEPPKIQNEQLYIAPCF